MASIASATTLSPHEALILVQAISAFIWTTCICLPIWIGIFGPASGSCFATLFALVLTGLGVYRFVVHGEVRHRVFGAVPAAIRAIFFAAPTHAVHGVAVGLFSAWVLTFHQDGMQRARDEEEREEIVRDSFFMYLLLGWTFSSMFFLEKRHQVQFGRLSHKSRIQTILDRIPMAGMNVLALNLLGLAYRMWSPLWVAITLGLELNDAILIAVLSERSRKIDFDNTKVLATSMRVLNGNPVAEAFQDLPLLVPSNGEGQESLSRLFSKMPWVQDASQLAIWWAAKRNQSRTESTVTGSSSSNFLLELSKTRFETVKQVVYRCDALDEGCVFAKPPQAMQFTKEALRIRAFGIVASCPADLAFASPSDWNIAVNSCLDVLDSLSVRLSAFERMAALEPEGPRNSETGSEEIDLYVGDKLTKNANMDEVKKVKEEAMARAWDARHKRFSGQGYWERLISGNLVWGFDPIYEEVRRRKSITNEDLPTFIKRDFEKALLDEFNLACRASEAAVCLATKKKPGQKVDGDINPLVEATLQRCLGACDSVERVFEEQREPHDLLYALQFCLERDLQMLRG